MATQFGNDDDNEIVGTIGADFLAGLGGRDRIFGGFGNDTVLGDSMIYTITDFERPAGDWLYGDANDDLVIGGAGNDHLFGGNGNDLLLGGYLVDDRGGFRDEEGNDTIAGGNGDDSVLGGLGNDVLRGQRGADTVDGGDGDDHIDGGDGDDWLLGGSGDDSIVGGNGADTVDAGMGYDTVETGDGNDLIVNAENIHSGSGDDTIGNLSQYASIKTGNGDDYIHGTYSLVADVPGDEPRWLGIVCGRGDDTVVYATGRMVGGLGDDLLLAVLGGSSNTRSSIVNGGWGDDTLGFSAHRGNDVWGGGGSDLFQSSSVATGNLEDADTIHDFEQGVDLIDLTTSYEYSDIHFQQLGRDVALVTEDGRFLAVLLDQKAGDFDQSDFTFNADPYFDGLW